MPPNSMASSIDGLLVPSRQTDGLTTAEGQGVVTRGGGHSGMVWLSCAAPPWGAVAV